MIVTDKDEGSTVSDTKSHIGGGPPSYDDAVGTSRTTARKPPCNHLYVVHQNQSIKGSWTVDPNLKIPPALLPSVPQGTTRRNLLLSAHNGSVSADISIAGEEPGKASLEVRSKNGSVKVVVVERPAQKKFALSASSYNGSVSVHIPRDFCGPITFKNGNGSTSFSTAVEEGLTIFSKQNKEGRAFLGDWANAGYGDESHETADDDDGPSTVRWEGDELDLESKNGRIRVLYNDDEEANSCAGPFGWLSKLFGGDQASSQQQPRTPDRPGSGSHSPSGYGRGHSPPFAHPHVSPINPMFQHHSSFSFSGPQQPNILTPNVHVPGVQPPFNTPISPSVHYTGESFNGDSAGSSSHYTSGYYTSDSK